MATVKCDKCGGIIPDGASFCPGCGNPKAPEPPAPQPPTPEPKPQPQQTTPPPPAPAMQPVYKPPKKSGMSGIKGIIDAFTTKTMIVLGLLIGVLVAWIARIVNDLFLRIGSFESDLFSIINYTFMTGVGLVLLLGGFFNKIINKYVRVGLIVAGALIIAANL